MIKRRINIRMSGLGGQGVVTSAHVMAMAASKDGKQAISNPFFGAEKRSEERRVGKECRSRWSPYH